VSLVAVPWPQLVAGLAIAIWLDIPGLNPTINVDREEAFQRTGPATIGAVRHSPRASLQALARPLNPRTQGIPSCPCSEPLAISASRRQH
jgi:hypothetical protein